MFFCPYDSMLRMPLPNYKITVNTKKFTLFLYKNNILYKTYPVGVGKIVTPTPSGTYKIINKAFNPGGPFGARWLGLNKKGYGIHGTNNPASIGGRVSSGCIRLYNKDIIELYNLVPIGTSVRII